MEGSIGSPTFTHLLSLHAMLFDPGVPFVTTISPRTMLLSWVDNQSAIPIFISFSRLNHSPYLVYGLQCPCLRLTHVVTSISSKLSIKCAGSTSLAALSAASKWAPRGARRPWKSLLETGHFGKTQPKIRGILFPYCFVRMNFSYLWLSRKKGTFFDPFLAELSRELFQKTRFWEYVSKIF